MQLKKQHRKRSRDILVNTGTLAKPNLVPFWQVGKSPEDVFIQLRSRQLNPRDPLYVSETVS